VVVVVVVRPVPLGPSPYPDGTAHRPPVDLGLPRWRRLVALLAPPLSVGLLDPPMNPEDVGFRGLLKQMDTLWTYKHKKNIDVLTGEIR
jgi:hypothetical protein